jgi:hypothetical protein
MGEKLLKNSNFSEGGSFLAGNDNCTEASEIVDRTGPVPARVGVISDNWSVFVDGEAATQRTSDPLKDCCFISLTKRVKFEPKGNFRA